MGRGKRAGATHQYTDASGRNSSREYTPGLKVFKSFLRVAIEGILEAGQGGEEIAGENRGAFIVLEIAEDVDRTVANPAGPFVHLCRSIVALAKPHIDKRS